MAKATTDKSFEEFFRDGMSDVAKVAFPTLGKLMDFSKKKDEDKATDSADDAEDDIAAPKKRKKATVNAVANEMVLDSLEAIDERLKVQSIVLVSQLEQQTITNQLLNRLAASGTGMGGGSSSGGSSVLDTVTEAVGGASIGNFIKTWGTKLLGGAAAALAAPEVLIGAAGAAAGYGLYKATQSNPTAASDAAAAEAGLDPSNPGGSDSVGSRAPSYNPLQKRSGDDKKIKDLEDMLARIEAHLKLNNESEAERLRLSQEELALRKKIKDLQREEQGSGPHGVVGPDGTVAASTPFGRPSQAHTTTPVSAYIGSGAENIPIRNGHDEATHTAIGQGETALQKVRGGGMGQTAGGQGGGGGGGTRKGDLARPGNQSEAWKFFKGKGYTDEETATIMGNLQQESGFNPGAHNPNDAGPGRDSDGIAQWNDGKASNPSNRRTNMMDFVSKQFGKPYDQLSASERYTGQLGFIDHELNTTYKGAREKLKGGDYKGFGHAYEGYGSPDEGDQGGWGTRSGNAQRILARGRAGQFDKGGASGEADFTPPKNAKEVLDHLDDMKSRGMITNEECVSLATATVGIKLGGKANGTGQHVNDWTKGESIMDGTMKPGTPIATFLDRHGNSTSDYAHGGNGGQRGANLDHAAVFENYVRDKDGKITGMSVAEQYDGSGGIHEHTYSIDGINKRTGQYDREHDATSYSAIKLKNGEYLGGKNNPMSRPDMPHRNASLGTMPRGPGNSGPHPHTGKTYRPEDSKNANLDANNADDRAYMEQYEKYSEDSREFARKQAYAHIDKQPSVSSLMVNKTHQDVLEAAKSKAVSPVVQNFNTHGPHGTDLTKDHKSDRMSSKKVGHVNPPTERLKELFGPPQKGF